MLVVRGFVTWRETRSAQACDGEAYCGPCLVARGSVHTSQDPGGGECVVLLSFFWGRGAYPWLIQGYCGWTKSGTT